jgi:hypothetical protein
MSQLVCRVDSCAAHLQDVFSTEHKICVLSTEFHKHDAVMRTEYG